MMFKYVNIIIRDSWLFVYNSWLFVFDYPNKYNHGNQQYTQTAQPVINTNLYTHYTVNSTLKQRKKVSRNMTNLILFLPPLVVDLKISPNLKRLGLGLLKDITFINASPPLICKLLLPTCDL